MNTNERILGIVEDGRLHILSPEGLAGSAARLTGIGMQVSEAPEREELDLAPEEGKALMVEGHSGGGWIYSAQVIDEAGPILTAVVRRLFASEAH